MERALETWIVLLLVVAPWQHKVIAEENSATQSSKSLNGDNIIANENSKVSKSLPENKSIFDSNLQANSKLKHNATEDISKLDHLPKYILTDNKSQLSSSYTSEARPFHNDQKVTTNRELNSEIHKAIKRHIGAFLKTHGKPNFSRTETKRYSDEQSYFDSSENDLESLIPEVPMVDYSGIQDENKITFYDNQKRNLGAFMKTHGKPIFRQSKASENPELLETKRNLGSFLKSHGKPVFNSDNKRLDANQQFTDEDKRNLGAFLKSHGKPIFGNVDDKRNEMHEEFEEDKRNIGAFLKSHGKPSFQNTGPKRSAEDIEEDKRNLGAFLKSHGKPNFAQDNKRQSDFEYEDKRNLGAFLKSRGKPNFMQSSKQVDADNNESKRNLAAFLKSHGKPVFGQSEAKNTESNADKRNLGAFLKSHGKPVFEQSGNKRIAANEIIVDDKRNLGAFLKSHGKPKFGQSGDQNSDDDQKRNLGAFLKSHGKPTFGQTDVKQPDEQNISDKRNLGAFLKQHGKPVFDQKDSKKSSEDNNANNQIYTKSFDVDDKIVKKDENLQNNFDSEGLAKRQMAKFLKNQGKIVFSDQEQNSLDNLNGDIITESDKRNIASFMRNRGKPIFTSKQSILPTNNGEDKRHIGSFLNAYGRPNFDGTNSKITFNDISQEKRHIGAFLSLNGKPVFSNNENKRPFRNGNTLTLTKRHVGAFLNAHGKPVFGDVLQNTTKKHPNGSAVKRLISIEHLSQDPNHSSVKRHVGAFLSAHGKPIFTSVDDKRLAFLDPDKRYGDNIVRLTRTYPQKESVGVNGEKEEVLFPYDVSYDLNNDERFQTLNDDQLLYADNDYDIAKRNIGSFLKSHGKPNFAKQSLVRQHRSVSIANPFNFKEESGESNIGNDNLNVYQYPPSSSEWSSKVKRNVAVLARNGWLSSMRNAGPPMSSRFPYDSGSKREIHHFPREENDIDSFEDDSEECTDMDESEEDNEIDNHIVKRNIGALARSGRLPPWHRRREWWTYKRGIESLARMLWPRHPLFGSFADKRHFGYLRTPMAFKQKRCKKETRSSSSSPDLSNDINVMADNDLNKFDTQSSGGNLVLMPQRFPGSSL